MASGPITTMQIECLLAYDANEPTDAFATTTKLRLRDRGYLDYRGSDEGFRITPEGKSCAAKHRVRRQNASQVSQAGLHAS